jgi:phage gpG-like protein
MKPYEYFEHLARNLDKIEGDIARDIVAVEAEQFHAKNFRDQGFTDSGFTPWKKRKTNERNTKTYEGGIFELEHRDKGRALLVQSGTLKRHALKGRVVANTVTFEFPLVYERVHNEGGRAGRGNGFQMPQRQYVGESEYLKKRIEAKAKRYLDEFLNNK